jgi:hypothetical protein
MMAGLVFGGRGEDMRSNLELADHPLGTGHRFRVASGAEDQVARDDFSSETTRRLAHRAGFYCAFQPCGAHTAGPSDEGPEAISNVGVACHIAAASPGGRRFDATMTPEERRSIENGIWMCQTHAKRIDDDEVTFTVVLLKEWKRLAEERARAMVGVQTALTPRPGLASQAPSGLTDHARRMKLIVQSELLRPTTEFWEGMKRCDLFLFDRVTIHDVDRSTYPDLDQNEVGPSCWFKTDLWDIHDLGIEVAHFSGIYGRVLADGTWDVVHFKFRDRETTSLGFSSLIPFEVIRRINARSCPNGDYPHIYCDFAYGQSPYSHSFVYSHGMTARLAPALRRTLYPEEHRLSLRLA